MLGKLAIFIDFRFLCLCPKYIKFSFQNLGICRKDKNGSR